MNPQSLDTSSPFVLILLTLVGVAAGAINTVAGGGSLITLPVLFFAGLPPAVANATNRIGVLLHSTVAVWSFARSGSVRLKVLYPRAIAGCLGALIGAQIAASLEPKLFKNIIAAALLFMLAIILLQPKRWLQPRPAVSLPVQLLSYLLIGIYGGFLQAGAGIFLLALGVLFAGEDLVRANVAKNFLVAAWTGPALVVFFHQGLVAPVPGLCLGAGSMVGGYIGARLTLVLGAQFVRGLLAAVVALSATRLLGLW